MQLGAVFPQTEIGNDPAAIRDFAQAAEGLGYSHIIAFDHVLGADRRHYPDWTGVYDMGDAFHEPFVLFSYLAAVTQRIQLATGIIILPQRQTALVAKQAAEVDVLSGGRLRLGVGIGWNPVEYEALGEDFNNRGERSQEQIEVLRALWTQESVDFHGQWHNITGAGLNPLPIQRPIPLWLGGQSEQVLQRIGRHADGWLGMGRMNSDSGGAIQRVRTYAEEAGRDPDSLGFETLLSLSRGGIKAQVKEAREWERMGATHGCYITMKAGLESSAAHIKALEDFKAAMDS